MKTYQNMKDSGVEWIGEIPEDWSATKIKYSDKVIMGQSPSSDDYVENGNALPFLQGNADFKEIYPKPTTYCETANKKAKNGDILLSVRAPIGAVNIADQQYGIGRGLCAIRSIKNDSKYLYYQTLTKSDELNYLGTGTTYKAITVQNVNNTNFAIPPKPEQTQIVAFLDDKTTKIDKLISKKERKIELLKEERKALINQAVTKGIDPTVPMKDSGVEWIGEIPEGWEISKLKFAGRIVNGYAFKSSDFKSTGVRVVKISNIQTMKMDWTDESFIDPEYYDKLPQFRVNKGDIVIALTRPIISTGLKASFVETDEKLLLNQRNALIKPNREKIAEGWFYYIMFNQNFIDEFDKRIDKTGQQPNISAESISNIQIPFPKKHIQEKIVSYLNNELSGISNLSIKESQKIELLKEYRQALISEVVTGKVDVRNEVAV